MLTPQSKAFLKSLGLEPKRLAGETGYSPKDGKGKQPKAKKTELEKLQEGWQGWDDPLKKKLSYGKGKT